MLKEFHRYFNVPVSRHFHITIIILHKSIYILTFAVIDSRSTKYTKHRRKSEKSHRQKRSARPPKLWLSFQVCFYWILAFRSFGVEYSLNRRCYHYRKKDIYLKNNFHCFIIFRRFPFLLGAIFHGKYDGRHVHETRNGMSTGCNYIYTDNMARLYEQFC